MSKVVSIYEGKTNLSKLVKRAKAGETILIGSYGEAEAMLTPLPPQSKVKIGVWQHKAKYVDYAALDKADDAIADDFTASLRRPINPKRRRS